jgi:hypothetical protein
MSKTVTNVRQAKPRAAAAVVGLVHKGGPCGLDQRGAQEAVGQAVHTAHSGMAQGQVHTGARCAAFHEVVVEVHRATTRERKPALPLTRDASSQKYREIPPYCCSAKVW